MACLLMSRGNVIVLLYPQLNIHRFKVLARFGLMHIVATNLCVWIRTLVLESIKEITNNENRKYMTGSVLGPSIVTTTTAATTSNLHDRHLGKFLNVNQKVAE